EEGLRSVRERALEDGSTRDDVEPHAAAAEAAGHRPGAVEEADEPGPAGRANRVGLERRVDPFHRAPDQAEGTVPARCVQAPLLSPPRISSCDLDGRPGREGASDAR